MKALECVTQEAEGTPAWRKAGVYKSLQSWHAQESWVAWREKKIIYQVVHTTFHLTMIQVTCSKENVPLIYNPKTFEIILLEPRDIFFQILLQTQR